MRLLILIPAYNEAANLPVVVGEIRATVPDADILVVDDGSDDGTRDVVKRLGVRWISLALRLGVGVAVRTGLRYAQSHRYDAVVRVDGDGQHPAMLIPLLLQPLMDDAADVVMGSRYATRRRPATTPFVRRLMHYLLGRILSLVTGQVVTDPTSGSWAFGKQALALLAEHHPSGYPEPELLLFLSRNRLRVAEVPVTMRERFAGQTSLTMRRTGTAMARLLLHLAVVPWRAAVREHH
jgi:glycosyltransferase involved in cell wall biosynthesis